MTYGATWSTAFTLIGWLLLLSRRTLLIVGQRSRSLWPGRHKRFLLISPTASTVNRMIALYEQMDLTVFEIGMSKVVVACNAKHLFVYKLCVCLQMYDGGQGGVWGYWSPLVIFVVCGMTKNVFLIIDPSLHFKKRIKKIGYKRDFYLAFYLQLLCFRTGMHIYI